MSSDQTCQDELDRDGQGGPSPRSGEDAAGSGKPTGAAPVTDGNPSANRSGISITVHPEEPVDGHLSAFLAGDLDLYATESVNVALAGRLSAGGYRTMVLDMRDVSYLDSSGLAVVLGLCRRLPVAGVRLVLRPGSQPAEVFRLTGLDNFIRLTYRD